MARYGVGTEDGEAKKPRGRARDASSPNNSCRLDGPTVESPSSGGEEEAGQQGMEQQSKSVESIEEDKRRKRKKTTSGEQLEVSTPTELHNTFGEGRHWRSSSPPSG